MDNDVALVDVPGPRDLTDGSSIAVIYVDEAADDPGQAGVDIFKVPDDDPVSEQVVIGATDDHVEVLDSDRAAINDTAFPDHKTKSCTEMRRRSPLALMISKEICSRLGVDSDNVGVEKTWALGVTRPCSF